MHVSVAREIHATLIPNLQLLRDALKAKADEFNNIVKIGRTHLQVMLVLVFFWGCLIVAIFIFLDCLVLPWF